MHNLQPSPYAICTSPIMHLICPPKCCISTVFNFSWDSCNTQEKGKTKVMQNFGGQKRCIMGDVLVANRRYRLRRLILDSTVSCDVTERHLHPFPGFADNRARENAKGLRCIKRTTTKTILQTTMWIRPRK